MTQTAPLILAADIGGTNTRVALLDGTTLREGSVTRFENAKSEGLEPILKKYLQDQGQRPDAVSLALAGPVNEDAGQLTNLHWAITTKAASEAVGGGLGVLLNDLQAQGHALPFLSSNALRIVQARACEPKQTPCLMIGVGTGMNVAPVHRFEATTYVPPAEAGHTSFSPQDSGLTAFKQDLATRLGHVASEDILSGRGLERAYLHVTGRAQKAAEVMALCHSGDAQASEAIGLMVRALGHFAGDMALTHLPVGGIYMVGGVARALTPYFETHGFLTCFADKGRFSEFMQRFPVYVVEDDYAALIGAASYAVDRLSRN